MTQSLWKVSDEFSALLRRRSRWDLSIHGEPEGHRGKRGAARLPASVRGPAEAGASGEASVV